MPTRSEAERCLAGRGEMHFVDGYPSTFVVQLFRLLAECPADLPAPDVLLGPWIASCSAHDVVLGALSCALVQSVPEGSQGDSAVSVGYAVTVGYDVAPSREGQGYATEMLRLVCAHLLAQPGIVRVCADTDAGHSASRRVMEKAGLSWRCDETEERDGRATTVAHYALDRGPRH